MIESFKCRQTKALFEGEFSKQFNSFASIARRKLDMLHAAISLKDLSAPPGNGLEKLTKDRQGQHSIRINDQFRICFKWNQSSAHNVEIVDYH
jgi:toxin HigB-1